MLVVADAHVSFMRKVGNLQHSTDKTDISEQGKIDKHSFFPRACQQYSHLYLLYFGC